MTKTNQQFYPLPYELDHSPYLISFISLTIIKSQHDERIRKGLTQSQLSQNHSQPNHQ